MSKEKRREYKAGAAYQRTSDWRWIGAIDQGYTESGGRKRHTVSIKGCVGGCKERCPHRQAISRKIEAKRLALARGEVVASRLTVKGWSDTYLERRQRELSPKGYNAAASAIRKWVVPTIGHRQLAQLTPADVRAVHDTCRRVGRQAGDVHRALHTMLTFAAADGHHIAPAVLAVPAPKAPKSDRAAMTIPEGLAMIKAAAEVEDGTRWLFTLLYGQRQGECLGLTWDAVDFEARDGAPFGEALIEWQLQALPYNVPRDRSSGFRIPDGYEARHLVDSYHLVRPKSRAGYRVAPLLEPVRDALLAWRDQSPDSPYGLVWPGDKGRPRNDKHDRAAWWALQATAGVHHPTRMHEVDGQIVPGPYHVHECRNFAATMLLEADVPEHVVTDLLGHTSVATSLRYRTRRRGPLLEAMQRVGERLQLG